MKIKIPISKSNKSICQKLKKKNTIKNINKVIIKLKRKTILRKYLPIKEPFLKKKDYRYRYRYRVNYLNPLEGLYIIKLILNKFKL